jgi:hypothetical protein
MQNQQVEDIQSYGRFYNQMLQLAPESYMKNFVVQGPGIKEAYPSQRHHYFDLRQFGPGDSKTMSMPIVSGLFTGNSKWLPLRWINCVLEIELAEPSICCRSGTSGNSLVTTYTSNYSLSDVQLKADICQIDSSLEEEFSKVLLSGRKLSISCPTFSHSVHSLVAGEDAPTITSTRAVSRLKTVFASFFAQRDATRSSVNCFHHPIGVPDGSATHPATAANDSVIGDDRNVTYQWLLNGQTMPVMPVRTFAESWQQLTKAMGQHNSTQHSIGISELEYMTTSYTIANDYEKVLQAGYTGTSLRSGGQLSLQCSNMSLGGTVTSSSTAALKRCYLLLFYDLVVEIGHDGVVILD